ncbi:hypothetical protein [Mucilaginibacter defluvii]
MRKVVLLLLGLTVSMIITAQVQLQSGSAEYSLPIFTYSDPKAGLSSTITLNYSAGGGIRAGQLSSNVGLGWDLVASGEIERIQNGQPDDQYNPIPYTGAGNHLILKRDTYDDQFNQYYGDGFLYTPYSVDDIPKSIAIQPRFGKKQWYFGPLDYKQSPMALADREQDVFSCNLNGRILQFVIGKNRTIECLDDSKLKIEFTESDMTSSKIRTKINCFIVTDETGLRYKFNALELSDAVNLTETYSEKDNDFTFNVFRSKRTDNYIVTKWHLTEISNALTGERIIYNYTDVNIDVLTDKNVSSTLINGQTAKSLVLTENRTFVKGKRLISVQFPDGHSLELYYGGHIRIDVPGDEVLNGIVLKYSNRIVKRFDFLQSYFYKKQIVATTAFAQNPAYDKRFARLCLKGLQVSGIDGVTLPPYQFDYYTGSESQDPKDIVPSRYTFSTDEWGYYNKSGFVDDEATTYDKNKLYGLLNYFLHRQIFPNAATFGMLKSVTLPSGGKTTYEYEQNNFSSGQIEDYVAGVRVKKITVFDDEATSSNQVTEYRYVLENGYSSGKYFEGTGSFTIGRAISIRKSDNYDQGGIFLYDQATKAGINAINKVGGYLVNITLSVVNVGWAGGPIGFAAGIYIACLAPTIYGFFDQWDDAYMSITNLSSFHNQNRLPFLYSRVEYSTVSAQNSGKTVAEFSVPANWQEMENLQFPYSAKQRYEPWRYGLPIKTSIYNSAGALISITENTYQIITTPLDNNFRSCKIDADHYLSGPVDWPVHNDDDVDPTWIKREFYNMKKGRSVLSSTLTKLYNSSNAILSEQEVFYEYNSSNNLLAHTYSSNSKGEIEGKSIYYSDDYDNSNVAIHAMKDNHIIGVPLCTVLWRQAQLGATKLMVSAAATEYQLLSSGRLRPVKKYSTNLSQPVANSLTDNPDPANPYNYSFFEQEGDLVYNMWGDLINVRDTREGNHAMIYGYHKRRIVADVVGASPDEVVYTSFEKESDENNIDDNVNNPDNMDMGNGSRISYSPLKINNAYTVMGDYNFPAEEGISFTVKNNKQYILTVWATDHAINLDGAPPDRTGPTINGYTYYEFDIAPGSTNLTFSGDRGVYIDEFRVYPKGAKMSTTSYDPTFGKTAECDINNRISYFEYDGLGRLVIVKDDRRNIIKTYEYHYKTK